MPKTETLDDPPTSIDPYAVLGVLKTASEGEIKLSYKKLALKTHPDKVPPSERASAHTAFQALALAYAVLSDPARRARYDRTGSTEESITDDAGFDWTDYYRAQFADVVTEQRIAEIKAEYQGAAEERRDVLAAYIKYKGNVDKVFEVIMLSDVLDDEERFRAMIDAAIEAGEVPAFEKYTSETAKTRERRRKRAVKEREEAERAADEDEEDDEEEEENDEEDDGEEEEAKSAFTPANSHPKPKVKTKPKPQPKSNPRSKKSKAPNTMNDLASLIQQRQAGRATSFFENLEAKYGGAGAGAGAASGKGKGKAKDRGTKRAAPEEPSEEAFAAMAARGTKAAAEMNGSGSGNGKGTKRR